MQLPMPYRMIVSLLRLDPEVIETEPLRSLGAEDWQLILHHADRLGVLSIVWKRLHELRQKIHPPGEIARSFRRKHLAQAARSAVISRQTVALLELLETGKIPAVLLKGVHLAVSVYEDSSLRPMRDIDILVRESDLEKVRKVLLSSGYEKIGYRWRELEVSFHVSYIHKVTRVPVEVHFALDSQDLAGSVPVEEVWERLQTISFEEVKASALGWEDLVLYHAFHTAKHFYRDYGLRSLLDMAMIVSRAPGGIDWSEVRERAQRWKLENISSLTLAMTRDIFNVTRIEPYFTASTSGEVESEVYDTAVREIFGIEREAGGITLNIAHTWQKKGVLRKLRDIIRYSMPEPAVIAERYQVRKGSPLLIYYYLINISYYFHRYGKGLWLLMKGDKRMEVAVQTQLQRDRRKRELISWLSGC